MKEENILKKLIIFRPYECDAIVEYLEEMAKEGWRLKEYDIRFVFERIEPQTLHYAVEVFEKASLFDMPQDEKNLEELEHYKKAGWAFLCSKELIYIFVSDKENPILIQTDWEVKRKNIQKATRKTVPLNFSFLVLLASNFLNTCDFSAFIASNDLLFLLFITIGGIFTVIRELFGYFRWSMQAKRNVEIGLELPCTSYGQIKRNKMVEHLGWIFYFGGLLLFLVIPTMRGQKSLFLLGALFVILIWGITFGVMTGLDHLLNRKLKREESVMIKFLAGFVIVILMIVGAIHISNNNNTPEKNMIVTAEQLGIAGDMYDRHEEFDQTLFAEKVEGSFWVKKDGGKGENYYDYTLLKSRFPWVIKGCVSSELGKRRNEEYRLIEEPAWKAKQVYRKENKTIETMVVYPHCIFTYENDGKLTAEQIARIIGKLQLQEE